MPDFTVDIGGLDALGKNLDRTSENIDNATRKLADASPGSIGSDELDEACADFREIWDGGLGEIRDAVAAIKEGLDAAIKGYAELENGIEAELAKMATNLESMGAG
ncbi:hypothetical protein [Amycolatopsis palatopharyngis]|uniref:hypothetical protein n=1 Tax=Amycolatopsis palatopharyngis TaxID=187982 RepID=UPI000E249F37|nr:hypothetical protein [Amycolatopsis palatopharyngis]